MREEGKGEGAGVVDGAGFDGLGVRERRREDVPGLLELADHDMVMLHDVAA